MNDSEVLTTAESQAVEAMVGSLIDEAHKHGFQLMGIDYPAIAVREALSTWLVAARSFRPIKTTNGA